MSERLDTVGYWTEIKLQILQEYAKAYARIMAEQQSWLKHVAYIDGFAGAGAHISKESGQTIAGSPARILAIKPGFNHYYFVEMDVARARQLGNLSQEKNVTVYHGDCNTVLMEKVFPKCRYEDFRRALCLLDPYALNPNWEVVETAGKMRSIEIFLNFMIMDANMNVLWNNPDSVSPDQAARMTRFWGDDSWRSAAYTSEPGLFGPIEEKSTNDSVVSAYRKRLKDVAGFKYVPEPIPMRNSRGAVVYYLFFASQKEAGSNIVRDVFKKYRNRTK